MATLKSTPNLLKNCGQLLAIINGRFLPVKDLSITLENNNHSKNVKRSSTREINHGKVLVEITTCRNPCLYPDTEPPCGAIIISKDYKIDVKKPVATYSVSEIGTESRREWTVTVQGVGCDVSEW